MASVWDPLELYIGPRQRAAVDRRSQAVPRKTKTEKGKSSAVGNLQKEQPAVAIPSNVTLGYTQPHQHTPESCIICKIHGQSF